MRVRWLRGACEARPGSKGIGAGNWKPGLDPSCRARKRGAKVPALIPCTRLRPRIYAAGAALRRPTKRLDAPPTAGYRIKTIISECAKHTGRLNIRSRPGSQQPGL